MTEHRPWPLPKRPWALRMDWEDLLFLHWPIDAAALGRVLPLGLEVETYDGSAWLGVVPFRMERTRFRWLPGLPTAHRFLELNVRTYVRSGGRSGVWFASLDAASRLAVAGARATFGLPYMRARMNSERHGEAIDYRSERIDDRAPTASFRGRWRAVGESRAPLKGTLEHFLTERYCMFVPGRKGTMLCGDIAHRPWQLAPATVELEVCDMTRLLGIELQGPPTSVLMAERQEVVGWRLRAHACGNDSLR